MSFIDELLKEYDVEMANTRKMLDRVPEEQLDWGPHPKSMTLKRLAWHVADFPNWALYAAKTDLLELGPDDVPPAPNSKAEILAKFDKDLAEGREKLAGLSEEDLQRTWTLKFSGETVLELPKAQVIRSMVMNHMVHHRGQLSVYLRELNVPVPGMYGPSADEM